MSGSVCAEFGGGMNVCYILDGVLILYGVVLTVLYCRLKMTMAKKTKSEKLPAEGGVYAVRPFIHMIKKTVQQGLTVKNTDVYESIDIKKSIV